MAVVRSAIAMLSYTAAPVVAISWAVSGLRRLS
ncbi:hypothetical protein MPEAHAMD_3849 [Methylobacterium frigidaeris]|uniref:Uncharacterized protein n=1 Tax=Methylobacterium frigidaeris TaxID=2038277 RepID=A0AA37HCX2_9HYPH|nr:hypothetical protein MPEAHAMD_3849 [Methylobacterium frigidaeris]